MNLIIGDSIFKKRATHLLTYESGPSKTQVDCLVRRNRKKQCAPPPFCRGGWGRGGGGLTLPLNFKKRGGGLDRTTIFRGGTGKEWVTLSGGVAIFR